MAGTVPTSNTVSIGAAWPNGSQPQLDILNLILAEVKNIRRFLGDVDGKTGITLVGSVVKDYASLAAGAQDITATVTVTGAALGDMVDGLSFSLDLQGMQMTAYVSSANTVTVVLRNGTGGAIDLASGTIRVSILPKATVDNAGLPAMVLVP